MKYQHSLPFDDSFAWESLVKNVASKLTQGQIAVYYGMPGKKITLRKVYSNRFLVTCYTLTDLDHRLVTEGGLTFVEVEFMSTALKTQKHVHSYVKSLTKHEDWKKQIYKCSDPHCRSYDMAEKIINKVILCANCGETTISNYEQIRHRNRKLVCLACSKSPKKETLRVISSEMDELFKKDELEKEQKILDILE